MRIAQTPAYFSTRSNKYVLCLTFEDDVIYRLVLVFQVMFHNGMSNNERDFEMCFRVDNVILPKTGYFGVSAATGGLAGTENGGGLAGTVKPRHQSYTH